MPSRRHPRRTCASGRLSARRSDCASGVTSATTHHSFGGSFSAGSTPIFASKYAFCSIFQNLQENHLLASKFCKFLKKMQTFAKFDLFSVVKCQNFCKFLIFFAEICKICSREDYFLVDFEKCCKMRIRTRKSASIQPRTRLRKGPKNACSKGPRW